MNCKKIVATISKERRINFYSVRKLPRSMYATVDRKGRVIEAFIFTGTFVSVVNTVSQDNYLNLIYFMGAMKFSSLRSLLYRSNRLHITTYSRFRWNVSDYES